MSKNAAGRFVQVPLTEEEDDVIEQNKCRRCCKQTWKHFIFVFNVLFTIANTVATGHYLYLHGVQINAMCTHNYQKATGYRSITGVTQKDNTSDVWVDLDQSVFSLNQLSSLKNGSVVLLNSDNKRILSVDNEDVIALQLQYHGGSKVKGQAYVSKWFVLALIVYGFIMEILILFGIWFGNIAYKYVYCRQEQYLNENKSWKHKAAIAAAKSALTTAVPLCITCWLLPVTAFQFDNYVSVIPNYVFSYETVMTLFHWSVGISFGVWISSACIGSNYCKVDDDCDNETCGTNICLGGIGILFVASTIVGLIAKIYEEYNEIIAYGLLAITYVADDIIPLIMTILHEIFNKIDYMLLV